MNVSPIIKRELNSPDGQIFMGSNEPFTLYFYLCKLVTYACDSLEQLTYISDV